MDTPFPHAAPGHRGYDRAEVDAFFDEARRGYEREGDDVKRLTARAVRRQGFRRVRDGYDAARVDEALERLEDALGEAERDALVERLGEAAFDEQVRAREAMLRARMGRPNGQRFRRVSALGRGYAVAEVDDFMRLIDRHLSGRTVVTRDEVRRVSFTPRQRGYDEAQVDLFLDAVVELLIARDDR